MTLSNYKSTVGGAFSALGTTLMGIGVVPQLAGQHSTLLSQTAVVGFFCMAIGQFLGHLFAADAKTVADLSALVAQNSAQIQTTVNAVRTGDTSMLSRSEAGQPAPQDSQSKP